MSSQSNPPPPRTLPSLSFSEAIAHRRSVYALTSKLPSSITDKDIESLVKDAVLHVPSAFNSQTTRCVLLVKTEHQKFWDEAMRILKEKMGDEGFEKTKGRLEGFKGGYGTILFFEDNAVLKKMQERTPAYASLFPGWAEHASGMHQFVLWTALEAFQGVGCNLQHYNMEPLVTEMAKKTWSLPEEWDFKAQLVFGGIAENGFPTEPKPKEPTEKTVKVFGV